MNVERRPGGAYEILPGGARGPLLWRVIKKKLSEIMCSRIIKLSWFNGGLPGAVPNIYLARYVILFLCKFTEPDLVWIKFMKFSQGINK